MLCYLTNFFSFPVRLSVCFFISLIVMIFVSTLLSICFSLFHICLLLRFYGQFFLVLMIFRDRGAYTVCPRISDPFYVVLYYIKWVTTSWTYSREFSSGVAKKRFEVPNAPPPLKRFPIPLREWKFVFMNKIL